MNERTGVPIPAYMGMPKTGTRGRKHHHDSDEAARARDRVVLLAVSPEERAKALENDKAAAR